MHCRRDSLDRIALDLGDCIGVESCLDLRSDFVGEYFYMGQNIPRCGGRGGGGGRNKRLGNVEKEYPPPIPSLARIGSLFSHMPWIMRRYYTNDGRLIIKEEKVERHEYFQAHRFNGRLTLHLVPLDDVFDDEHEEEGVEDDYREVEYDRDSDKNGSEMDGFNGGREAKVCREQTVFEEGSRRDYSEPCMDSGVAVISGGGGGGGGERGKCYEYSSISRSSWRFMMAVAATRPVHT